MSSRSVDSFLDQLWALDDLLAEQHGYPRISPWWRRTIERFYRSGNRRFVVRKGRRVGASTIVAPRLAVAEMLWGQHRYTPGAPPLVFAFVSVKRDEAANRLRGVKAILNILGEPYSEPDGSIELVNRSALFKVVTANFRTSVGDTIAWCWCDELSRWNDDGANPAQTIISTIAPALATLPDATLWLISSPLGHSDYHARQYARGETADQSVAFGETWTINPTLSEAETRRLEPDEDTWRREYAAVPSDALIENYFGTSIDPCIQSEIPHFPRGVRYYVCIDPAFSTHTFDRFGVAVLSTTVGPWDSELQTRVPPRVTRCHFVAGWVIDRKPREIAARLRDEVCQHYGTLHVYADQHGGPPFVQLADDVGIHLEIVPWSPGAHEDSKSQRYSRVRREMYDGQIHIPNDLDLIRELRATRSTILASGGERIDVPRTRQGHGDRASAFVLGASIALEATPQLPTDWETIPEQIARAHAEYEWQNLLSAL